MLSRVADTLYWLARYMERTHAMLQVTRIHYQASQDSPSISAGARCFIALAAT